MMEWKQRDYRFDAIRGFCMWLIVFQHFIEAANCKRNLHDPDGLIYFVIDLFVMQCFFFLSGYFSKKPERGNEIAIPSLLWPLLVTLPFFFVVRAIGDFDYVLSFTSPPFAMWFLLCLFYYRMFQKHYVKVPHIFGIVFVLSLFVPIIPYVGNAFSLARAISWAPYFLLGYFCQRSNMNKICSVKWYVWAPLGVVLILAAKVFLDCLNPYPWAGFVQMYDNIRVMGISWWGNILMRLILLPVSAGFMLILFNIFKNKKSIWTYLGMHTMPIYIFHIVLFFVIQKHGAGLGLFTAPELPGDCDE